MIRPPRESFIQDFGYDRLEPEEFATVAGVVEQAVQVLDLQGVTVGQGHGRRLSLVIYFTCLFIIIFFSLCSDRNFISNFVTK